MEGSTSVNTRMEVMRIIAGSGYKYRQDFDMDVFNRIYNDVEYDSRVNGGKLAPYIIHTIVKRYLPAAKRPDSRVTI
jgi:hypothetical protein